MRRLLRIRTRTLILPVRVSKGQELWKCDHHVQTRSAAQMRNADYQIAIYYHANITTRIHDVRIFSRSRCGFRDSNRNLSLATCLCKLCYYKSLLALTRLLARIAHEQRSNNVSNC